MTPLEKNKPILEQVARAICISNDDNPDLLSGNDRDAAVGIKMWEYHIPDAKAAIQALIDADWTVKQSLYACGIDEAKAMLEQILVDE